MFSKTNSSHALNFYLKLLQKAYEINNLYYLIYKKTSGLNIWRKNVVTGWNRTRADKIDCELKSSASELSATQAPRNLYHSSLV